VYTDAHSARCSRARTRCCPHFVCTQPRCAHRDTCSVGLSLRYATPLPRRIRRVSHAPYCRHHTRCQRAAPSIRQPMFVVHSFNMNATLFYTHARTLPCLPHTFCRAYVPYAGLHALHLTRIYAHYRTRHTLHAPLPPLPPGSYIQRTNNSAVLGSRLDV